MTDIELDRMDLDLIAALQHAPRAPFDVLARALDSSARTITRRYARLVDAGVLTVICEVDWSLLAEGMPVNVWIQAEPGQAAKVAKQLSDRPDTTFVATTTGTGDVFCMLHGTTRAATAAAVANDVPGIAGIHSLRTEWVLRRLTSTAAWRLPRLDPTQIAALSAHAITPDPTTAELGAHLSDLERATIDLLRNDARLAYSCIARALDITESRARRTVAPMLDSGLLRPRVEVDPRLLGYQVEAVLGINCRPHAVNRLAASLTEHPATRFLALTGATTMLTYVGVFHDEQQLADFLTSDFPGSEEITSVECSLQLDVFKRYWIPRPIPRSHAAKGDPATHRPE
ncbi:Lrp/AsnC family transcriptional regulator [Kitasatospora sp. NPDC004669]|uniref:Lrp/AsnC family transcriptional regulator n=1 Tax=Kitasatospora sp. NPDC004669 TaxID=3154555 RepID=UPI0033B9BE11